MVPSAYGSGGGVAAGGGGGGSGGGGGIPLVSDLFLLPGITSGICLKYPEYKE